MPCWVVLKNKVKTRRHWVTCLQNAHEIILPFNTLSKNGSVKSQLLSRVFSFYSFAAYSVVKCIVSNVVKSPAILTTLICIAVKIIDNTFTYFYSNIMASLTVSKKLNNWLASDADVRAAETLICNTSVISFSVTLLIVAMDECCAANSPYNQSCRKWTSGWYKHQLLQRVSSRSLKSVSVRRTFGGARSRVHADFGTSPFRQRRVLDRWSQRSATTEQS